uniref:DUF1794 domain-containing protein n=1 Tax=Caenorhabditis tropicalis TaxID=1561998 RepID=A0A1I7U5A3_9PELO
MDGEDHISDSSSPDNSPDEGSLLQRHQETQGMNQILQMVTRMDLQGVTPQRGDDAMSMGGLQEELSRIEREQEEVIQRLDSVSHLPTNSPIPRPILAVLGTWRADSDTMTTDLVTLPSAFNYKYMWFKLEEDKLHCITFKGYDFVRTIDTIGLESEGDGEGVRKMAYVEGNRLVTSHRRQVDGEEVKRVEMTVTGDGLRYVYRQDQYEFCRNYVRAFSQPYQY